MDARVRYTKKMIQECFIRLLQEKPINKITVTEVCKGAEINRATFYKYYDNPYDLVQKIEENLLGELQEEINSLPKRTIDGVFRKMLVSLDREWETYRMLFSENGDKKFIDRILDTVYQENMQIIRRIFPDLSDEQQNMLFYFLGEGCNGILKYWIANGRETDIDEIVSFTDRIVNTLNRHMK